MKRDGDAVIYDAFEIAMAQIFTDLYGPGDSAKQLHEAAWWHHVDAIRELAIAAEREACAAMLEQMAIDGYNGCRHWMDWGLLDTAAAAIRERGEDE